MHNAIGRKDHLFEQWLIFLNSDPIQLSVVYTHFDTPIFIHKKNIGAPHGESLG